MNKEILDYINRQRVGVLAVEMLDGSPHAAAIHFAHTEDPLMFLFETNRNYRKSEALLGRELSRATMVIGCSEQDMKTLQMDGEVRLMTEQEKQELFQIKYKDKFPAKRAKADGPDVLAFVFIPKWWRYTDWTKPKGKIIIDSENSGT